MAGGAVEPAARLGSGEACAGAGAGAEQTKSPVSSLSVTLPLRCFAGCIAWDWAAPCLPSVRGILSRSGQGHLAASLDPAHTLAISGLLSS